MWKYLHVEGRKMCFVENNTSAIVTLYLIVNSVDVQMIY